MAELIATLRNRALVTLMVGHFTVDSYVGVLPVLYPLLIGRFHLSLGTVGLVTLAYTGMASVSQPVFGLIADRWGTRFTGLALIWTAATFAAVGFAPSYPALLATIGVMASRSWTTTTLQAFTPTWYHLLGYGPWFYGPLATTIVLASAIGTVGCGSLADRFGRRTVILASLVLSVPAVALFVLFPGPLGFLWGVLVGGLAASTAPLMLLLAQELMAWRAGLASGLIMGLGLVPGSIGTPITGAIADHFGLQVGLAVQIAVVVATIPIALLLPGEAQLRRLREAPHELVPVPGS